MTVWFRGYTCWCSHRCGVGLQLLHPTDHASNQLSCVLDRSYWSTLGVEQYQKQTRA